MSEITSLLGILNTAGHQIGDNKKYIQGQYDWSSWIYGSDVEERRDADCQLEEVIEKLLSKVEILKQIKQKYDCQFRITQVPIVENGECPALVFSPKVIDFCAQIGADIDIDLYVNPYPDENELLTIDER
ncbi:DUF4279 domain-containing protein [Marinicrinis sediminis]|uniref:DUF4279 domain-containing protein n=1 Tax=Marinicrinis sediminis TaxID=1652465 RepID=UPI0036D30891